MSSVGLLVFARCLGFVFRAPGFSHPSVPAPLRAGLALILTAVFLPGVHGMPTVHGIAFLGALVFDLCIGAAIGFAASLLYDGAYAGGRAIDDYVGIRGSVPDVQLFAASGFGRIWSMVFTAGFFLLGGYRIAISAFAAGFESVPPGGVPSTAALYAYAVSLPVTIVKAALLIAAPGIALVFVTQATLAALARVIPRFAAFTLSFPIVFGMAVIVTLAAIPLLVYDSGTPWIRVPFLPAP